MGWVGAIWGVTGVGGVLLFAIVRLTGHAADAIAGGLTAFQWVVFVANLMFMAYAEGYRGFQCRFSPRVAARALYLRRNPDRINVILAPLFCVGYYQAEQRTRIGAWVGTLAIIAVVIVVQQLAQPWRGVLDAGVVLGLSWGLVSLGWFVSRCWRNGLYCASPEIPGEPAEPVGAS